MFPLSLFGLELIATTFIKSSPSINLINFFLINLLETTNELTNFTKKIFLHNYNDPYYYIKIKKISQLKTLKKNLILRV